MAMMRRQYVVARTRKRKTEYFTAPQLRDAIKAAKLKLDESFQYGVLERQNQVECVVISKDASGAIRYAERGK